MTVSVGTRLGRYEIIAPLGAGGMGKVYRARDTTLDRAVAIKVLPESFAHDPERLARFNREAKTLAALNHPHIGGIYGVEEANGVSALVLELVEGLTLADRIEQGAIPTDEALPIARQIAEALEAAHEQGIIHRDLKPANIKLRPDGTVKVLDFGLAKALNPDGGGSVAQPLSHSPTITSPGAMTSTGVILGTAAYMAPEQARGKSVDKRADVWGFGCVLYEMLTSRRAFEGEDVAETLGAVIHKQPAWNLLPAGTPSVIRRVLERCLEKDPKQRLRDIGDARLDIDSALRAPVPDEPALGSRGEVVSPFRSALAGWLAAAALAILCIILAVLASRSASEQVSTGFAYRSVILAPEGGAVSAVSDARTAIARFARGVALSPDGRRLAFIAPGRDGRGVLWVRPLDALTAQPLTGTEGAASPFWSPDNRHLAFVADRKLKRIDASGGPALTLYDGADVYSTGTWNKDDVILFAEDGKILRIRAAGGPASAVTSPDSGDAHSSPFFLPDGRRFLYSATATAGIVGRAVYVGALDSDARTKVRDTGSLPAYADGFLLFVVDDTLMAQRFDAYGLQTAGEMILLADEVQVGGGPAGSGAFTVSQTGVLAYQPGINEKSELVWFDRRGKELGVVTEPRGFTYVQLLPDERFMVVSVREDSSRARDIWLYDTARGARTRITDDPADDFSAALSPNGDRVVFSSIRGGGGTGLDLYEQPLTGVTAAKRLLDRKGSEIPTSWSSDGRFILFQTPSPGADIWALSLQDSNVIPFATTRFGEISAQFSPDDRWVAYSSDETGRAEVYVAPFGRPGARVPISTQGGASPRWRHDGKELFYIRGDNTLIGVEIRVGETSIEVGAALPLFQTQFRGATLAYAVTSDGRFLVNRAVNNATPPPIMLVVNWPAALRK
jgi:Tol biopolymer transport system component